MFRTDVVTPTPIQQLVLDRLDVAVQLGVVGLALVIFLLSIIAVRKLSS